MTGDGGGLDPTATKDALSGEKPGELVVRGRYGEGGGRGVVYRGEHPM